MEKLRQIAINEYTDIKNNTHKVSHYIVDDEIGSGKKQVVEELFQVLNRLGKRISV